MRISSIDYIDRTRSHGIWITPGRYEQCNLGVAGQDLAQREYDTLHLFGSTKRSPAVLMPVARFTNDRPQDDEQPTITNPILLQSRFHPYTEIDCKESIS